MNSSNNIVRLKRWVCVLVESKLILTQVLVGFSIKSKFLICQLCKPNTRLLFPIPTVESLIYKMIWESQLNLFPRIRWNLYSKFFPIQTKQWLVNLLYFSLQYEVKSTEASAAMNHKVKSRKNFTAFVFTLCVKPVFLCAHIDLTSELYTTLSVSETHCWYGFALSITFLKASGPIYLRTCGRNPNIR